MLSMQVQIEIVYLNGARLLHLVVQGNTLGHHEMWTTLKEPNSGHIRR